MGAAATVEDPSEAGLGHGVGFVVQRLFRGRRIPVIPMLLNTYYPPNAPSSARGFDIGRKLREAIEESASQLRVAVVASGGLSHFVVDEQLDRRVLDGMSEGRGDLLASLPREAAEQRLIGNPLLDTRRRCDREAAEALAELRGALSKSGRHGHRRRVRRLGVAPTRRCCRTRRGSASLRRPATTRGSCALRKDCR
jgi:hypothetical protein